VHTYFDAKKMGYYFAEKQISLAPGGKTLVLAFKSLATNPDNLNWSIMIDIPPDFKILEIWTFLYMPNR